MTATPGELPLPESKLCAGLACWRMDHLLVLALAPLWLQCDEYLGPWAMAL